MMGAPPSWAIEHLRPGEAPRWWARPSMVGIVPILASTVAAVAAIVASYAWGFDQPGLILTGIPALVLALGGLLIRGGQRFVRLRSTSYVVTRDRLYVITSRLTSDVKTVPLARVTRVSLQQGPLGRALGYWSAEVRAFGSEASHVVVPAIRDGQGLLDELGSGMDRSANANWLLRGD